MTRTLGLSALLGMMVAVGLNSAQAAIIGSGPLSVGLTPVVLREDAPASTGRDPDANLSAFIARTVSQLLPNYLQRSLEKAFERRVSITNLQRGTNVTDSAGQTLNAIISPTITNAGPIGIHVVARIALRPARGPTGPQFSREEILVLAPNSNFGDIDEKLSDFGMRIAARLAELSSDATQGAQRSLPHGIMLFECITPPAEPDRKLQQLARILTIEFPHHLGEAARSQGLEVVVRGLNLKEIVACDPSGGENRVRPESHVANFIWTGKLVRPTKESETAELFLNVRERSGNFRPLASVDIGDTSTAALLQIADRVVKSFVEQYAQR